LRCSSWRPDDRRGRGSPRDAAPCPNSFPLQDQERRQSAEEQSMRAAPYGDERPRGRSKGFTVIELMFAVTVVALLAAVALPSYSAYRTKALNRQAAIEIAAMSASVANYWNDAREYPNSLADVGLGGKLDPWGRSYVYYNVDANGKGQARKDHALNPINTDFDLYSMGKDGVSKSQLTQKDSVDDILRAKDGAFVGLAADF
jgi:general secretion pathway protein G